MRKILRVIKYFRSGGLPVDGPRIPAPDSRLRHVHVAMSAMADTGSTSTGPDTFGGSMLVSGGGGLIALVTGEIIQRKE